MMNWARNFVVGTAVTLGVMGMASKAEAVMFDFGQIAETLGEQGAAGQGAIGVLGGVTVSSPASGQFLFTDGLTVDLLVTAGGGDPYLDAFSGGLPAGLGVCANVGTLNGIANQCTTPSDDNVTVGEDLTFSFFEPGTALTTMVPLTVTLDPQFYRASGHGTNFPGGMIDLTIDANPTVTVQLSNTAPTGITGSKINFAYNNAEFYVESSTKVPEPMTLALLGGGLVGIGFAVRRRRVDARV